jgi:DNA-binding MarR family transcriptional regulator
MAQVELPKAPKQPKEPKQPTQWIAESMAEPALHAPQSILDLLNYQLHVLMSFSTAGVTRMCEQEFGITRHEWGYIALLQTFGAMAPSELALRSGMDRSRTSKALVPLLAKGLVHRHPQSGDRRRAQVALSTAGTQLYERIFPRVLAIHHALIEPLSAEQVAQLAQTILLLRRRAIALQA